MVEDAGSNWCGRIKIETFSALSVAIIRVNDRGA